MCRCCRRLLDYRRHEFAPEDTHTRIALGKDTSKCADSATRFGQAHRMHCGQLLDPATGVSLAASPRWLPNWSGGGPLRVLTTAAQTTGRRAGRTRRRGFIMSVGWVRNGDRQTAVDSNESNQSMRLACNQPYFGINIAPKPFQRDGPRLLRFFELNGRFSKLKIQRGCGFSHSRVCFFLTIFRFRKLAFFVTFCA